MGAEQLDFTGGMLTNPEAIEAVISRMCHFVAAKDAEIAKLRADLDQARRDRNSAVECAEVLRGYVAEGKAEIAKLRAERDEWRDKAHSLNEDRAAARDAVFKEGLARIEAEKQLAAASAALDGEREALAAICDEQASLAKRDRCHSEAGTLHQIAVMIRARRAAEAQPTPVRCPECDGTGRRVKYHGGSINDPNLIGLAMESLPCRCQAAEARP